MCLLSAAPAAPGGHCAAVLRKLGADRAQLESAFACLPLLPPLVHVHAEPDVAGSPALWRQGVLRRAAAFLEAGAGGTPCVLVLDDVSLAAGVLGPRAAVELVQACRALLLRQQSVAWSLLVRAMDGNGNEDEDEDEEEGGDGDGDGAAALSSSVALLPLLLRHADVLVEVRPLASGYSRDVHGLVRRRRFVRTLDPDKFNLDVYAVVNNLLHAPTHICLQIRVRAASGAGPELVNFRLGEGGIRCDRITIKS